MKERDTISSVDTAISDDDNANSSSSNEDGSQFIEVENDVYFSFCDVYDTHEISSLNTPSQTSQQIFRKPTPKNCLPKKKKKLSCEAPEPASKTLMQFIVEQKEKEMKEAVSDKKELDAND